MARRLDRGYTGGLVVGLTGGLAIGIVTGVRLKSKVTDRFDFG